MTDTLQKVKKFLCNDVMCVVFWVCFILVSDVWIDGETLYKILANVQSVWVMLLLLFIKIDQLTKQLDALRKKLDEGRRE